MKVLSAILIICCLFAAQAHEGHVCEHDKRDSKSISHYFRSTIEDLDLATIAPGAPLTPNNAGAPFRIFAEYSTIKTSDATVFNYISKKLMPSVIDYFTAALKLKYPLKEKLKIPNYSNLNVACDGGIPMSYVTNGVDADLVILVRVANEPNNGAVAQAMSCIDDTRTGRTIVSTIKFNLAKINLKSTDPLVYQQNLYTTMHELCHVLGFSFNLFQKFLLPNGQPNKNAVIHTKVNGQEVTYLNVEPLTPKVKKHFKCDLIPGAPLENEGGSGSKNSHFERKVFFNEFMTASEVHDGKISEFTLALLEGSGWYTVDYSMAEPFHVGQEEGCGYLTGQCTDRKGNALFEEFCTATGKRQCAGSYNGMAVCSNDQFSDGCGLPHSSSGWDCRNPESAKVAEFLKEIQVFGPTANSKCFMGDLLPPNYKANGQSNYCFTYKCTGSGLFTAIEITVGKSVAKCTKKGLISVAGYSGKLDCPDPTDFCNTVGELYCPRGCLGRGACSGGKCQCKAGFKGDDCGLTA